MAGKAKRLSKVAREMNVGISTITEFLAGKGIDIESSPNTKIEADTYSILQEEYQSDISAKEAAKKTSFSREKREAISLEPKKEEKPVEVEPVAEVETPAPVAEEPIVEEPLAEVAPEPEVEEVKKEEEKVVEVVEEPKQEKAETPEAPAKEDGSVGVSVVGKIDLSSIPSNKKKKAKEAPKKKEAPAAKKEEPKKEIPVVKKEEPKKEEAPVKEEPKEVETIKVKTQALSGPTVVGKIVLPVEKPKKKIDHKKGDDDGDKKRRKRKRIKKVNPNAPANQQQRGGGNNFKKKGGFKKGAPKPEVTQADIQKEIKETLARLSGGGKKSKGAKNRRAKRDAVAERRNLEEIAKAELEKGQLKVTEFVTVSELATMMNVSPTEVVGACMSLGIFASINQRLDAETLTIVADEFGFELEFVSAEVQESIVEDVDDEASLVDRAPIVTVMGHVDHGKTSLLDHVRKANVIAGEAGGITQHIGAYSVELENGKRIAFLDTPGHEAFTAMRARGAQVTDVAIIIIAADDNVMPQTKEAINHAQAAGVPMVIAINKIDKPGANPDKIKEELSTMNILVEDWGGKFQCQEISAKHGKGIDELLEKVLLEAEMLELKANPDKSAVGTVIESSLDKGRGYVSTVMVEAGTMKVGDMVLAGCYFGKVKAMHNERGGLVKTAGPATPVELLGLNGAPNAGDKFNIMTDEREAKEIAAKRTQLQREQGVRTQKHLTLDEIGRRLALGDFKELNVIVKGDVDGSIEALSDSLQKLSTEEIQVNIIHKGVGQITESDVLLATASDAIIIGFQVRPSAGARRLADNEQIDIRLYSIIYQAIEELKSAMEGMLSPDIEEKITGTAEIRETFKISKVGTIAGCFVTSGKIKRNNEVRLIRDGIVIYTGLLGSLKRFKDDVKEVNNNYECGLNIDKYNNIEVGDIVEAFEQVEVAKKLK